jgi:hypothetical protein
VNSPEQFGDHVGWVRMLARRVKRPRAVDTDDLVQVGLLALHRCLGQFDPSRGIKFRAYAQHRVVGAMRDAVRAPWRGQGKIPFEKQVPLVLDVAAPPESVEVVPTGRIRLVQKWGQIRKEQFFQCDYCKEYFWGVRTARPRRFCGFACSNRSRAVVRTKVCSVCSEQFTLSLGEWSKRRARCDKCLAADYRRPRCRTCHQPISRRRRKEPA